MYSFVFELSEFLPEMDLQFKRGDKLILELVNSDEILEGEYVDGSKDRLTIMNISSHKSKHVIKGPYSYYRSDISSVRILDNANHKLEDVGQNSSNLILISKLEYERLKTMSCNYIYIATIDSRYYDAMNYIKNCETIGLAGITTSYEKTAQLSLISFSTWDQVYMLDFLTLNVQKFPQELKEVLECDHVKKVVHDTRLINEILTKRFKVKLTNVFDTKVADIAVRKKNGELPQSTRSLSECLVHYFNFPITLMSAEDKRLDKWKKRPLSDLRKFIAAQKVSFLVILKNHLEHALLQHFYQTVDEYSKSLQNCCLAQVEKRLCSEKLCDVLNKMTLE